jgi:hypothetical protein
LVPTCRRNARTPAVDILKRPEAASSSTWARKSFNSVASNRSGRKATGNGVTSRSSIISGGDVGALSASLRMSTSGDSAIRSVLPLGGSPNWLSSGLLLRSLGSPLGARRISLDPRQSGDAAQRARGCQDPLSAGAIRKSRGSEGRSGFSLIFRRASRPRCRPYATSARPDCRAYPQILFVYLRRQPN